MFHRWTGSMTKRDIWVTPAFAGESVSAGYSFREGGYSEGAYRGLNLGFHVGDDTQKVTENRAYVAECGFGPVSEWVVAKQVHGNGVAVVGQAERSSGALADVLPVPDCDALVTNEPDTTLVVLTADCVPVLFYDPIHHAIGAAHSGWKGTTLHIVQQVFFHMNFLYHTEAKDLQVSIGPSIRRCCYEVDDKVADPVRREFGEQYLVPRFQTKGKYFLSLQACIQSDLRKLGVPAENIDDVGVCTSCHTDVLFSHRAEHGRTGRECGLIRLNQ
ncbi:peptidoglycan editing factor PgeF [Alicyclobacillus mengziensis]|uniref:Purine nucleoside phosphorylase n=1 Tax=Alicyclobacillus mengziensis TaxID=2931921 RepID=A0A9X7W2T8_9BACL|nr:peptidoglycan editing factor PgeF [Alicyclobacillus mengziensis]QSO49477.1 peptidoglycan editing factor PgeF [Alicyclobacillus mengziensis]